MIIKNLIAASILLAAFFSPAQTDKSFIKNLGIKVNYGRTFSFSVDQIPNTLEWERPNYGTFRLGLSYDLKRESKLSYNFNASIDWLLDKNEYLIKDPEFNPNNISSRFSYGGTIYFILETQFLYALDKEKRLNAMLAPQINFFLFDDLEIQGFNAVNNETDYSLSLTSRDRTRILRPSLAVGLQYDLSRKSRLGLFYSHSFTPIYFGEFTYENSNSVTASGDWKLQGHQLGLTFQFFPFRK